MNRSISLVLFTSILCFPVVAKDKPRRRASVSHTKSVSSKTKQVAQKPYPQRVIGFVEEFETPFKNLSDLIEKHESYQRMIDDLNIKLGTATSPQPLEHMRNFTKAPNSQWLDAIKKVRVVSTKFRSIKTVPSSYREADNHFVEFSLSMDRALDRLKTWVYTRNADDYAAIGEPLDIAVGHYKEGLAIIQRKTDPVSKGKVYTRD